MPGVAHLGGCKIRIPIHVGLASLLGPLLILSPPPPPASCSSWLEQV